MSASSARCGSWSTTSPRTGRNRHLATLPLIAHRSPDAVVAYRAGAPIRAAQFLADATRLAPLLGPGRHVLNACSDRYHFAVGLASCLISGKISLLPPMHTPEVIRQLAAFAADAVCLTDDAECAICLPQVQYPHEPQPPVEQADPFMPPAVAPEQLTAYVFTSGSTGVPVPHRKSWGPLLACVHEAARRLSLPEGPSTIVATVPPQHMYGLESSVLLALANGHALCAERPFYPADIAAALASVPRPRVLVSTPVHLRALAASGINLPHTDLIVCSTATLAQPLAGEVEQRFETRLMEIYGSTETGQIAARRTTHTPEWQLWPGVTLERRGDESWARGGHIEAPTRMCDVLEMTVAERFLLHGRVADLVNIAGKRSSLAYLNNQLNSIPGVLDGAFFHCEEARASHTGVTRVAACVVAPELDAGRVLEALRGKIDPVFLPRPLLFVERLPRNATGKLPQEALRAMMAAHQRAATVA